MLSKTSTTRGQILAWAAGALVSWCGIQVSAQDTAGPQAPVAGAIAPSWDSKLADNRNVRMNFLSTPWSKVLHDVAEQSGSTLVMLDVPPGKFSRHDWKKHDREDAVKILNRELEPEGFRVVIKDQFLTVMQIRRTRREYQRPVAPQMPSETA
ncbi:MAG: hypothetical protein KDA80_13215, partial [Planctomycetaceae bacterium]|nr:hypothetical protein [Planctomycetaceae bacterium]